MAKTTVRLIRYPTYGKFARDLLLMGMQEWHGVSEREITRAGELEI
jgi:hypothetical protein